MSSIEIIICLVLLLMAAPDVCAKIGRPALAFSAFVVSGLVFSPLVSHDVRTMLSQAGQVGFLLLLFEVGLEIELPPLREFAAPLRFAAIWSLSQYPIVVGLSLLSGLTWMEGVVAAAALTACSVGMAHPAWKAYPDIEEGPRQFMLRVMVALETMAIVLLAVETTTLGKGLSWFLLVKLVGIVVTVVLIARFGKRLTKLFYLILSRTTHWRVHLLVLLVLAICALGERLGLEAAKTAFFLGLFMSRARHAGRRLDDYMAPISRRLLIPIFFVALGLEVDWHFFLDRLALLAAATALLLLGGREILHRRWLRSGGDRRAFLLLCPNLTMAALAAKAMLDHGASPRVAVWLVLTGLFVTIPAILLLPKSLEPA